MKHFRIGNPGILVAMGPFRPYTGVMGLVVGAQGTNLDLPTNSRQTWTGTNAQYLATVPSDSTIVQSCNEDSSKILGEGR